MKEQPLSNKKLSSGNPLIASFAHNNIREGGGLEA